MKTYFSITGYILDSFVGAKHLDQNSFRIIVNLTEQLMKDARIIIKDVGLDEPTENVE